MHLRRFLILVLVAVVGGAALAGCGSDDKGNTLSIDAHEFAFDGAPTAGDTIDGGRTTIDLDNTGKQFHLLAFEQITGNHTDADVTTAIKSASDQQHIASRGAASACAPSTSGASSWSTMNSVGRVTCTTKPRSPSLSAEPNR